MRQKIFDAPFVSFILLASWTRIERRMICFRPWIGGISDIIATKLTEAEESLGPLLRIKDFDEEKLQKIIFDIEFQHLILCQNVSNLTSYLGFHPHFRTVVMATALNDLESLPTETEALQRRGQSPINRFVGTLALEEPRKSIQQSTSTKRLSQLAYIFLPLSLSTSPSSVRMSSSFKIHNSGCSWAPQALHLQ